MLEHGGQLDRAIARYGHPREAWLDLSTGINPQSYPLPPMPSQCWHRLPEPDPQLAAAAQDYYGTDALLAVAGSQAAIQALPALIDGARVGILAPSYNEHLHAWRGRQPRPLAFDAIDTTVDTLDVLIVVNPNNPTGTRVSRARLRDWHARLAARGGTLVVDEAFADADPADSLAADTGREGLVVLRSLGKFFGLAGARVGFVLAATPLREALASRLGPWTLGGPAQFAARCALADTAWQAQMRRHLAREGARLATHLAQHGARGGAGTALFYWQPTPDAARWQDHLARHAIWVRRFDHPPALRFGLPGDASGWHRLDTALSDGRRAGLRLHPRESE
jgi:cobalamin biosynthetic protein CobC